MRPNFSLAVLANADPLQRVPAIAMQGSAIAPRASRDRAQAGRRLGSEKRPFVAALPQPEVRGANETYHISPTGAPMR